MLTNLAIRDYAVVDALEVDLASGMTCITGETGAGKSIMLDALGLCVGDRADSRAVRPGASRTDISASFDLSQNARALTWLAERDLASSEDCILRRTISAEGRSRAYINGTPSDPRRLRTVRAALGRYSLPARPPIPAASGGSTDPTRCLRGR